MTITRSPSNCQLDVLLLLPIHVLDNVTLHHQGDIRISPELHDN